MIYSQLTYLLKEAIGNKPVKACAFGSGISKQNSPILTDYDFMAIGDSVTIDKILGKVVSEAKSKYREKIFLRKSIEDPKVPSPYIHALIYSSEDEFRQKQWPTVVNSIIRNNLVISGASLNQELIPIVSAEQITGPLKLALESTKNHSDCDFPAYLHKTIPRLVVEYPQFAREIKQFYASLPKVF